VGLRPGGPQGGIVEEVIWGLYELDDDFKPKRDMDALHESVDDEDEFPCGM
jgi:hypothetical protein